MSVLRDKVKSIGAITMGEAHAVVNWASCGEFTNLWDAEESDQAEELASLLDGWTAEGVLLESGVLEEAVKSARQWAVKALHAYRHILQRHKAALANVPATNRPAR